jgi:hypothetical protein
VHWSHYLTIVTVAALMATLITLWAPIILRTLAS